LCLPSPEIKSKNNKKNKQFQITRMEARVQPIRPRHFTMDLIVSLGGEDTKETRKMIELLNGIMMIWGKEENGYMETFINLVKSKTDELARTLDTPAQQKGSTPSSGSETKKELENKIRALEEVILVDKDDNLLATGQALLCAQLPALSRCFLQRSALAVLAVLAGSSQQCCCSQRSP
jgi:hypothetical protein